MNAKFSVRIDETQEIALCHGMWPVERRRALLDAVTPGDPIVCTDEELDEYLLMSLQDLDVEACGAAVLEATLGDAMTPGQRFEVTRDMENERPWETYSRMGLHRGIFEAAAMVHRAQGAKVTTPKACRLTLTLTPQDDDAREALGGPLAPAFATRLVGPMHPEGILMRLFDEAIEGDAFPEAPDVVWHCAWTTGEDGQATVVIEGSEHWFGDFEPRDELVVEARPDAPVDDE